jgi:release factor glutamine methyltransferase
MDEAELLFSEILHCDRLSLYLNRESVIAKDKSALVSAVLQRRISGEPIQYILGKSEFMGLEFKVTPDVLIPRPETEILVEAVLKIARTISVPHLKIIDIGTGSGNIAVSLAKLLSGSSLTATDISKEAIEIARYNAALNQVADKITFVYSDLFTSYELLVTSYDIIVSNPPYIPTQELKNLQPEIKYEPLIALDGGRDGLDFYRKIAIGAPYFLKARGFLITEIGYKQKDAVVEIFQDAGDFQILEIIPDYNNIDRVVVAQRRKAEWTN